jgi:putative transposase
VEVDIMRGPKPRLVVLEAEMQTALTAFVQRHSTPQQAALRARIVLLAAQGHNNTQIARQLDIDKETAYRWRQRWLDLAEQPLAALSLQDRFADGARPGAPAHIGAEVLCQIMALACRPPQDVGRPITEWTARELADEVISQGLVESISPRHVGRFLKRCGP